LKRIYAEPDEQTLEEIGKAAEEKGITRHKLVLEAIDSYLHQSLSDVDSLRKERDSLRSERDSLKIELDEKWSENRKLRSESETQSCKANPEEKGTEIYGPLAGELQSTDRNPDEKGTESRMTSQSEGVGGTCPFSLRNILLPFHPAICHG
jgi:hypothetical protein